MSSKPRTRNPISRKDIRWLAIAQRAALESDCTHRLGAALVIGGSLVTARPNRMRHNPALNPDRSCSIHAEAHALTAARRDPAGGTVYVARVLKSGATGDARPCQSCLDHMTGHGVNRVVWTGPTGPMAARVRDLVAVVTSRRTPTPAAA